MTHPSAVVPVGWAATSASAVCEKIQDGTHFSPKVQLTHGTYRYVTAKNVRPTGLDLTDIAYLREDDHQAIYARCDTRRNDVLLVKDGVNAGDAAINTLDDEISLLSSVCFLRPNSALLSPAFLRYYLLCPEASAHLTGSLTGTAIRRIVLHKVKELPVLIAPLPEQHRIVEAIESHLSRLDDAVATLERVQRNLKRYRASVLRAAVEGRLVPNEAELARAEGRDYEPAPVLLERILAERRRRWHEAGGRGKYKEPVAPDATDLPELPEGWCWSTVDALTISGSQNGLYVPKAKYGTGVPILRIDDYQTDWSRSSNELQRVDISNADADKYGLAVGDIVINRVNSPSHLGKSLAVLERNIPAVFESNMMRFALTAGVIPGFIQYYLSSTEGKARLTKNAKWAVNQASINQGDVGATAVPLPPVTEQRRIVAELATLLSTVAASEVASTIAVARCARLRQSILKWAFEGKLADHDPSDEPATALLERIRSQKLANRLSVGDTEARRLRRGGPRRSVRAENKP